MVVNRAIRNLMETGLSEYESRAYMGLLSMHPATAYEVAKGSGIPTSKIYEVMAKLEEKGIVSVLGGGRARKYIPMEPEEFLETRRQMIETVLEDLKEGLHDVGREADISYIWNLKDYEYLIDKAGRIIAQAEGTLLLSIWSDEMTVIADSLEEAEQRGVKIAAVHFGRPESKAGLLYQHPIHDTIYAEKGGRGLVLVGDSREAIVGTVLKDGSAEGAYSTNKGFVTLAEDYIKHDIYVMKMVRRFDRELTEAFGSRYEKMRDVFTDDDNL